MRKPSVWCHYKKPKKEYLGTYQWTPETSKGEAERVFVLSYQLKNGKYHNITFESYQSAKQLGWVKVK